LLEEVNGEFPGIPAPFPAYRPKFADFGQNLQNSELRRKNTLPNSLLQGIALRNIGDKKHVWFMRERPGSGFEDHQNLNRVR